MTRRAWGASLAGILLVALSVAPSSPAASAATTSAGTTARSAYTPEQFEARVLALMNNRRATVGCRELTMNSALVLAARRHNNRMVAEQTMSHQLPREASLGPRVTNAGYRGWRMLAENLAWGPTTPYAIYKLWLNSSGHRANMQNCTLRNAGVGMAMSNGHAWVTADFGHR